MISVSVIIPIYNCEEYLKECLNSVTNQSLKNIEIICIDDGSADSSGMILEQYVKQDNRIRVIFLQNNRGAGYVRNIGINKAQGQYIAFLDADDYYLDVNALEKMYLVCREQSVSVCGSLRKSIKEDEIVEEKVFDSYKGKLEINHMHDYEDIQCDYNYQSFLFEKNMIIKNQIVFPLYQRFEDPVFFVKAMYAAEKFYLTDTYLYCYRIPNVIQRFNLEKTIDLLNGLKDNLEFAIVHNLQILFQNTLNRIEYEYADIICHNMSNKDIQILSKLLEINQLVCQYLKNPDYIIRPLEQVLTAVQDKKQDYEKELQDKIVSVSNICIYGAGKLAKSFFKYLDEKQLREKINCFLVSSMDDNKRLLYDIPVKSVDDYEINDEEIILVAVGGVAQKEIVLKLNEKHIKNYELLDSSFLNML